jgi:hypothetical protein
MEASMRANGRWFTGPAILLGVAFALAGCDEDSGSIVREGDPALQVRGYSACDGNLLPVATLEDLTNDTLEYAQISATGIDPGRTSGAFEAGTAVKLYVGTNAGAPGGTGLRFRSTASDTEPQGKTVADLVFAGDQVEDAVFCDEVGTHKLYAFVERYERTGEPVIMAKEDGWPFRCVPKAQWLCDCQNICNVPTDAEVDATVDAGADAAPDLGPDAEVDAAPPSRYQISFNEPRGDALALGMRANVSPDRPNSVILSWKLQNNAMPVTERIRVTFDIVDNTIPENDLRLEPREVFTEITGEMATQGLAATVFQSGNRPGQVKVRATAYFPRAGSDEFDEVSELSPELTIISGLPSADELTFLCSFPIQPAFTWRYFDPAAEPGNNGDRWLVGLGPETVCTASLADRLQNRVAAGTSVRFTTEAGSIGGGVNAVSFTDDEGRATADYAVARPFPRDTAPLPYEDTFRAEAFNSLRNSVPGEFVYNPRDGLVRVIVSTRGEESFVDSDGDLVYTEGVDIFEPGTHDLGEPFVDTNDNNRYDDGEPYEDIVVGDGMYTPGNEAWDAETQIWTSTTLVWVGASDGLYSELGTPADESCVNAPNRLCGRGAPAPVGACRADMDDDGIQDVDVIIPRGGSSYFVARMLDVNGNCLDSRDSGKANLEIRPIGRSQPPVFVTTGTPDTEVDLSPLCFFNGVPEQPVGLVRTFSIVDPNEYNDPDDLPLLEFGIISYTVEHDLPAAVETTSIFIRYCMDFGEPAP